MIKWVKRGNIIFLHNGLCSRKVSFLGKFGDVPTVVCKEIHSIKVISTRYIIFAKRLSAKSISHTKPHCVHEKDIWSTRLFRLGLKRTIKVSKKQDFGKDFKKMCHIVNSITAGKSNNENFTPIIDGKLEEELLAGEVNTYFLSIAGSLSSEYDNGTAPNESCL